MFDKNYVPWGIWLRGGWGVGRNIIWQNLDWTHILVVWVFIIIHKCSSLYLTVNLRLRSPSKHFNSISLYENSPSDVDAQSKYLEWAKGWICKWVLGILPGLPWNHYSKNKVSRIAICLELPGSGPSLNHPTNLTHKTIQHNPIPHLHLWHRMEYGSCHHKVRIILGFPLNCLGLVYL